RGTVLVPRDVEGQQVLLHRSVVEDRRDALVAAEEIEAALDRAPRVDVARDTDAGHARMRARADEEALPGGDRALRDVDGDAAEQHAAAAALGLGEREAQGSRERLEVHSGEPGEARRGDRAPLGSGLGEAPRQLLPRGIGSGGALDARPRELEVEVAEGG